jgi:hypothetical protein
VVSAPNREAKMIEQAVAAGKIVLGLGIVQRVGQAAGQLLAHSGVGIIAGKTPKSNRT